MALLTFYDFFCRLLLLTHLAYPWQDTSCSITFMTIQAPLSFCWTPLTLWTMHFQVWYTPSQCHLWMILDQVGTIHQFSLVRHLYCMSRTNIMWASIEVCLLCRKQIWSVEAMLCRAKHGGKNVKWFCCSMYSKIIFLFCENCAPADCKIKPFI